MTKGSSRNIAKPNRRSFLKGSGLATIGAVFNRERDTFAASTSAGQRETISAPNTAADMVNLLQGTDSTPAFSRGNTLPIASLPFGMAHWTIQSHVDTPWMFQPGVRRIQGLRCTHQLSPWLGDYGYATFLPISGDVNSGADDRASSYSPEAARLTPYSLQLFLLRYRAHIELVPTERCALLAASFEKIDAAKPSGFVFDVPGKCNVDLDEPNRRIRFASTANEGGVPENFATYYVLEFQRHWQSMELKQLGTHTIGVVRFRSGEDIEARIATSFISFEQAALNMQNELVKRSVTNLRENAASIWNNHLYRIEIEGASSDQLCLFYSCLYRALLFPRTWHEPDPHGQMHHFSAFSGKVTPGVMYADHGYWDVYRAWYPLMSILFPDRLGEILQAWVNAYKEGGWLPQFPAPGYRACMTGSLIDSIFGDAAVKGISGFNLEAAYEGLKKHATHPGDPVKGYGRVGLEYYLSMNYIPSGQIQQSVAETVDAAYGDFCIAQVAKTLGKEEDYSVFLRRSENWQNLFDHESKFLRAKTEDGSWATPFDPFAWGSPYVEGAAWQHRWDAPHDVPALIDKLGGKAAAAAALEQMLTLPPIFHIGSYRREVHEMSEMAAVQFGQYAHSNQPAHHMLYLFSMAGRPDRTQYWVRKVMQDLYTPDKFPGDEDTGSMSAWFILSALGFYPVCPGKPEYTLGSPLFPRATLHLPHSKTFVIEAAGNNRDSVFVRSVFLNQQAHGSQTLLHNALTSGGTLRFEMSTNV